MNKDMIKIQRSKKSFRLISFGVLFGSLSLPVFAFASTPGDFRALVIALVGMVNDLVYLLIAMAVAVFMWGIVKFIWKSNEPEAREDGRKLMLFGVIAITVMVCVWGLVYFLKNSFVPNAPSTLSALSGSSGQ